MSAYYNEHDPFAADWLRELIADNLIAPGEVDERSIEDVKPDDLRSFQQCHFFAGIGVWSLAARLAGIPDDYPIWTGSCPCQPFSAIGKSGGFDDERHLWPAFFHLIDEHRPNLITGEQVARKDGDAWLDLVQSDVEAAGYAFGSVETVACGFGAPHMRARNYWLAFGGAAGGISDGISSRLEGLSGHGDNRDEPGRQHAQPIGPIAKGCDVGGIGRAGMPGPVNGFWRDADWLRCRDETWRPVEPGSFPLVDAGSVRNRVGLLRGAGNAVTIGQAVAWLEAVKETVL